MQAGLGCWIRHGRSHRITTFDALIPVGHTISIAVAITRVCTEQVLFEVGEAVAIGISISIGRIARIQAISCLPGIGHTIVIVIVWRSDGYGHDAEPGIEAVRLVNSDIYGTVARRDGRHQSLWTYLHDI